MKKSQLHTDAMDLALLIYDLYRESRDGGTINNGQNNAQQSQAD